MCTWLLRADRAWAWCAPVWCCQRGLSGAGLAASYSQPWPCLPLLQPAGVLLFPLCATAVPNGRGRPPRNDLPCCTVQLLTPLSTKLQFCLTPSPLAPSFGVSYASLVPGQNLLFRALFSL